MSEVSDLRDIFFNKLEKTSYGRNEIKKLFDDCYFKIHNEQNLSNLNNIPIDKIMTNVMSAFMGNNFLPKTITHNIEDIILSEHFFEHRDNDNHLFKDVTLTYNDTTLDMYNCNEHNIRMFKILYKV